MNKILSGFLKAGYAISKQIVPEIGMAERVIVGLKKGPDRRAAVVEGVLLAPEIVELLNGGTVYDQLLFREGVGQINDGYTKVMNSFKPTTPVV